MAGNAESWPQLRLPFEITPVFLRPSWGSTWVRPGSLHCPQLPWCSRLSAGEEPESTERLGERRGAKGSVVPRSYECADLGYSMDPLLRDLWGFFCLPAVRRLISPCLSHHRDHTRREVDVVVLLTAALLARGWHGRPAERLTLGHSAPVGLKHF